MDEREYFEAPVSTNNDVAEVVLEALYAIYDFRERKVQKSELNWLIKSTTNFHEDDISGVTDKLFDKERPYLMLDDDRVVFGTLGLWLLEDASFMSEDFDINPIDIVVRNLESNNFITKGDR